MMTQSARMGATIGTFPSKKASIWMDIRFVCHSISYGLTVGRADRNNAQPQAKG